MDYEKWAQEINERIKAESDNSEPQSTAENSVKNLLLKFVKEAGDIPGPIGRSVDSVNIQDRNRYHLMDNLLDKMLDFENFSMVEYRYSIPSKREPGIRFKVVTRDGKRRIVAVYFHDLVFWQVDEEGERVFMELCEFDVSGLEIKAFPNPELIDEYRGCLTWRETLR
ncbi:MAG: hypothetical protein HUJ16_00065 [Kangiella sp.]|nr:hypothetical protein [Kangiella sp.]